jgi:hypothetical protein
LFSFFFFFLFLFFQFESAPCGATPVWRQVARSAYAGVRQTIRTDTSLLLPAEKGIGTQEAGSNAGKQKQEKQSSKQQPQSNSPKEA